MFAESFLMALLLPAALPRVVSLVAYSGRWTGRGVHHRIKMNCHSDLRLHT
jgi:hypothetical protein